MTRPITAFLCRLVTKMSIRIRSKKQITTVTFLSDVDVQWISLAKRGANWTPFAMKSDPIGGNMAGQVIHAILVPKGVCLSAFKGLFGKDFDEVIDKLDGTDGEECTIDEFGDAIKYTPVAKNEFIEDSLQTVRMAHGGNGDAAIYVVAGALRGEKAGSAIDTTQSAVRAEIYDETDPVPAPTDEATRGPSFLQQFEDKLQSFVDVTLDTLGASNVDPKRRRRAIMRSVNGFSAWLSSELSVLGPGAVKSEHTKPGYPDHADITRQVAGIIGSVVGLTDVIDKLAQKTEIVLSSVESIRISTKSELSKYKTYIRDTSEVRERNHTSRTDRRVGALIQTLSDIRDQVDELTAKQETWEHLVLQSPSCQDDESSGQRPLEADPFSTMFDGRR